MNRKFVLTVSGTLAVCLFANASEAVVFGKAPSEVHLITSAPLASGSSGTATITAMDYVQHNAIHDAVYSASVPRETELRLGGLTITLP